MSYTTKPSAIPAQNLEFGQPQSRQARSGGAKIFLAGWFAGSLIVLASIWQLEIFGLLSVHLQSFWPVSLLASAFTNALRFYFDQSPTLDLLAGLAVATGSLAASPARWNPAQPK
jgi:hypothetical protein